MIKTRLTAMFFAGALMAVSCKSGNAEKSHQNSQPEPAMELRYEFNADSAYNNVARQVEFGPRIPGSANHALTGRWLAEELKRHGVSVEEQRATIPGADGFPVEILNILGHINPGVEPRTLLVAHWDTRPWADADEDATKHRLPVDGANDGASGVGVLLEIARILGHDNAMQKGIDILFVDLEDSGNSGDDDSWALGARYFAQHLPGNHGITEVILLDMVGGDNARFHREYFSDTAAPDLTDAFWASAYSSGYGEYFPQKPGGAINDDHLEFQKIGIPAIDIIEYNPGSATGFNPRWHTTRDNMEGISRTTLKAVGQTLLNYLDR